MTVLQTDNQPPLQIQVMFKSKQSHHQKTLTNQTHLSTSIPTQLQILKKKKNYYGW